MTEEITQQKKSSSNDKYKIPGSSGSEHQVTARPYQYQALASRDYRKAFGQFSSSISQRVETLEPVKLHLDAQEELLSGSHSIDFDRADIKIKQSGMYLIIAAPQVGRTCGNAPRWIDFWIRINNTDLPYSTVRRALADYKQKDVIPLNAVTPLNSGDIVNIMTAVETEMEGIGIESIEPDGEPMIPSVIVTIVQLD